MTMLQYRTPLARIHTIVSYVSAWQPHHIITIIIVTIQPHVYTERVTEREAALAS